MNGITFLSLALAQSAAPTCHVMAKPVIAGDIVDRSNTAPAPCGNEVRERKLRYDPRARVARVQEALPAGEPLGRVFLPRRPPVLAGDRIAIAIRLGPVTVTREGVALQHAGTGQRFFVRGDDGEIFAAPALVEEGR